MLNLFVGWAKRIEENPIGMGLAARVTESTISDNPSARLDIDTPKVVARITCWDSGDYDAEVLDLETERTLYSSHGVVREGQALSDLFAPFFKALGRPPGEFNSKVHYPMR